MSTRHFIIATAGHVDHGKSALVRALTGTDPDRLPEEKARGITIDLGFAELNLTTPDGGRIHAGIVDVPGHEDFVRNMIAGVGSIDLALFVVAADDGWMPQTDEHFQILDYLNVRHAVVALTKCDLGRIDTVTAQIRDRLQETRFSDAPIVSTSIRTGEGIENLKATLAIKLGKIQPQRDYGKPRLFVDRAFTLHGIGTVVTGTLTGGQFHRGQSVIVQPQNLEARIRSLQSHSTELECAGPGMRTAINLADVNLEQIKRGDVVTIADLGQPSSIILANVEQSRRSHPRRPLKNGSSVYVHHGTSRVGARISFFENNGIAQLKLAWPIFAFLGDRFVLRDPSERQTIGGGFILNPDGAQHRRSPLRPEDVDLCLRSEIKSRGFMRKKNLLHKSHFATEEIEAELKRLADAKQVVIRGEITADVDAWEKLRNRAIRLIDNAHRTNPQRAGLDLNELRAALGEQEIEVFSVLIDDLCEAGFVRAGSAIACANHRPALPVELQSAEQKIREALSGKPFDPPSRREIELDSASRQALRFLIESDRVIEISSDVVLLRESFDGMKSAVIDFISKNGPATVSELRGALGSSRRVMVPFLERLDRDGMTRRDGDKRSLR